MSMGDSIGLTLVYIVVCFLIFLALREVMCWYWKINRIMNLLQSIDSKLSGPSNPAGKPPS